MNSGLKQKKVPTLGLAVTMYNKIFDQMFELRSSEESEKFFWSKLQWIQGRFAEHVRQRIIEEMAHNVYISSLEDAVASSAKKEDVIDALLRAIKFYPKEGCKNHGYLPKLVKRIQEVRGF